MATPGTKTQAKKTELFAAITHEATSELDYLLVQKGEKLSRRRKVGRRTNCKLQPLDFVVLDSAAT
jgi:hypothetical protein